MVHDLIIADPRVSRLLAPSLRADQVSAWHGHVAFARWLIEVMRPGTIVELGTHNGVSYAAMCQAVRDLRLDTRCYAVDTWAGDPHAGFYSSEVFENLDLFNRSNFPDFSVLLRKTFDEALDDFEDASIDLLHIDGLHTLEAVTHDYETWLPKMSEGGVILFHDTTAVMPGFGVMTLWAKLRTKFPSFSFEHSAGLGVLAVGRRQSAALRALCALDGLPEGRLIRDTMVTLSQTAQMLGAVHREGARPAFEGVNIALNRAAKQSSFFDPESAQARKAVNGLKTGGYSFHTAFEPSPWWSVDLGAVRTFQTIVVYNRVDGPSRVRAEALEIWISDDEATWTCIYANLGKAFGGIDGNPLVVRSEGWRARYVKLQLKSQDFLHLDEVEIYATSHGENIDGTDASPDPGARTAIQLRPGESLDAIGLRTGTDKNSKKHDFLGVYERRLRHLRSRPDLLLVEIGVHRGQSLQMWSQYFPAATIVGCDIFDDCKRHQGQNRVIRIGDQGNLDFLASIVDEFGVPNVVIDDGSHRWDHQIATMQYFFPKLAAGDIYIIEDIDTSFPGWLAAGHDFRGDSPISAFDYVAKWARLVTGGGHTVDETFDRFQTDYGSSVESIEFVSQAAIITRK